MASQEFRRVNKHEAVSHRCRTDTRAAQTAKDGIICFVDSMIGFWEWPEPNDCKTKKYINQKKKKENSNVYQINVYSFVK